MSGSSDGLREGKERQGQVHEAIFEWLQFLVSLDNFDELQAHKAHDCCCGSGDGRNDLASYQFALDWMTLSTSITEEIKEEKEVNYFKELNLKQKNTSVKR